MIIVESKLQQIWLVLTADYISNVTKLVKSSSFIILFEMSILKLVMVRDGLRLHEMGAIHLMRVVAPRSHVTSILRGVLIRQLM